MNTSNIETEENPESVEPGGEKTAAANAVKKRLVEICDIIDFM